MRPARTLILIGAVFGAATEVFGGPVMSSWAHRRDEVPTSETKINGLTRYLNRHRTRLENFGDLLDQTRNNVLQETYDSLPSIAPDPLPEPLEWIGLAAKGAYFQSKQLDVNAEKTAELESARFVWNLNRL